MEVVHDIDRPDINGVLPRMQKVADEVTIALSGMTPVISVKVSDNLMSSVRIVGTFDERETWQNGIFMNSRYFRFSLVPAKGARYYNDGEKVTVELENAHYTINRPFRKSTTTPAKALERIRKWLAEN